jgi:hypothetical protein
MWLNKNNLKQILKPLFPVFPLFFTFKNIGLEDVRFISKKILLLLLPFIFVLSLSLIGIGLFSFITWSTPNGYYFPFVTGGEMQGVFDRVLLLIGVLLMVFENE